VWVLGVLARPLLSNAVRRLLFRLVGERNLRTFADQGEVGR
jgi:hypothetical protein